MNDQAIRPILGVAIPAMARSGENSSLLVDSAISHCEKLRRVLELEEWINGAGDNPMLATTCRKWQEEREQLLAELHLEGEASPMVGQLTSSDASHQERGPTLWLRKLMRLFV